MKDRLENFFVTLYRGTKSAWRKYHLLIPPKLWWKYIKLLLGFRPPRSTLLDPMNKENYNEWLESNPKSQAKSPVKRLKYRPLISFIIPVYNVKPEYLKACIDSVLAQTYKNIEICIVDDASTSKETLDALKLYEKRKNVKIKHRAKNGHISRTSNDALKMASGEYVALMDNDDIIPDNAIYEVVLALNEDPTIDMVYTDEDKIDIDGKRCLPNFKSDFAPDTFFSSNYMSHLGVLRKSIIDKIGGFRVGFEGAQDYDLYLRFLEKTDRVYHLPKILYHWRMVEGSTAAKMDNKNYAMERGRLALEEALKRRKIKGKVVIPEGVQSYVIEYDIDKKSKISIIIPTRDMAKLLKRCLKSVYEKTTYQNFEVIVVNNNSSKKSTFKLFNKYKEEHDNFHVIDAPIEFNYATLNNLAVEQATGDYIVLLNNDTEVITPNWLELMLGYASQKHVGAVGAKLLYSDRTIQHGGVILGLGIGSHAFVGLNEDARVWGWRLSVPYNYSAVTGACLMVSRKKWNEVGGLEEALKVEFNDVDFNLKLLEKGYYNVFLPMVVLFHHESKSRGKDDTAEKKKRSKVEHKYMYSRWGEEIKNDRFYNPSFSRATWYVLDRGKKRNKNGHK